jgi:hypothetical protein
MINKFIFKNNFFSAEWGSDYQSDSREDLQKETLGYQTPLSFRRLKIETLHDGSSREEEFEAITGIELEKTELRLNKLDTFRSNPFFAYSHEQIKESIQRGMAGEESFVESVKEAYKRIDTIKETSRLKSKKQLLGLYKKCAKSGFQKDLKELSEDRGKNERESKTNFANFYKEVEDITDFNTLATKMMEFANQNGFEIDLERFVEDCAELKEEMLMLESCLTQ